MPKIHEEQYSDYESGTDDPDSRTNLDQLKVRLSFDSALRSPSMCNVGESPHEQEVSSSPKKHAAKFKSKSPQKQGIKLAGSEAKDKKATRDTRHNASLKGKSVTDKQNNATKDDVVQRSRPEKRQSMIPISTKHIKKVSHKPSKVDTDTRSNLAIKKQKCEMARDYVATQQRTQKVSMKKTGISNTSVDTFATQSNCHIRPDSPPVPALTKKLASSAASRSGQLTDGNIKSPTILSKRTQRKVARRLDYKELPSKPKSNSVVRMQQQQHLQEPLNQQHEYVQQRLSNSPPVPAVAKKLQAHQLHKELSVEFDGNKRAVLPPIADQGLGILESDKNTVPKQASRRSQPVLLPACKIDQIPVEFKSNSPPVPALAKQISQQGHGTHNSDVTNYNERNKFASSELHSDSRFTYFSEPDTKLTAGSNAHYNVQPLQQVVYVPVSPQHFSTIYSQSAVNMQSPQQGVTAPPQIVSPVPVMLSPPTLSPVHSYHPQNSGMNIRKSKPADKTIQSTINHLVGNNFIEQSNVTIPQHDHRTVEPPLVVTTKEHQTLHSGPVHSPPATSQLSQEKDAVLQQLALMKKVCWLVC